MTVEENWNIPFSQNPEKDKWFLKRLKTELLPRLGPSRAALRILDLGCGSGELTFQLAELFPQSEVVGLDISEPNIARARRELHARQLHGVAFVCGDYLKNRFPHDHFDLIVADGVLHLIPDAAREIMPKIADELAHGGHVVFSIPDDRLFNRLLWLVRFILRKGRSSFTDRLILGIARIVHGKKCSDEFLRERINYMYMTPSVVYSKKLRIDLCQNLGLVNVHKRRYPHSSPGQFQHRFCIFSKREAAAVVRISRAG